jgi:hypothetical protein
MQVIQFIQVILIGFADSYPVCFFIGYNLATIADKKQLAPGFADQRCTNKPLGMLFNQPG